MNFINLINARNTESVKISNRKSYDAYSKWLTVLTLRQVKRFVSSFGWFSGVWILCADVSEHSVRSSSIGGVLLTTPMKMELTECSETSAHKIRPPRNHPEERTQHSEHDERFKSRTVMIFNEDKQNHVSNICLLILFHFISAINFYDLYRQTLINCRAYPDWDLGISYVFFLQLRPNGADPRDTAFYYFLVCGFKILLAFLFRKTRSTCASLVRD